MNYKELLVLSYFKNHYKKYDFAELMQLMGMTVYELDKILDLLLERKLLIIHNHCFTLSKRRGWKNNICFVYSRRS